jgi:hypothetical protein
MLSSPLLPAAVRQDLETRVISGERVGEPEIRAARDTLVGNSEIPKSPGRAAHGRVAEAI